MYNRNYRTVSHVAAKKRENVIDPLQPAASDLRMTLYYAELCLAVVCILMAVGFSGFGIATNDAGLTYCGFALFAFLIPFTTVIFQRQSFDLFEPINVVSAAVLFGTTLRSFYLVFAGDHPQARFLMMQQTFDDVNRRVGWILLGLALFCVGYAVPLKRIRLERMPLIRSYKFCKSRLRDAVFVSIALTLLGIVLYCLKFHINLSHGLLQASHKRQAEYVTDSGDTVYGSGWQFTLGQMTQYTFLLVVAAILGGKLIGSARWWIIALGLFVLATIIPFLSSSRTPIILLIFSASVIGYYYKALRLRTVAVSFAIIIFVVASMGSLRAANQHVANRDAVLDSTIGSGNGFDMVRSTAIIDRVPTVHDYIFGRSYLAIPVFFVPRAVWPDKPNPGLGGWVKSELFHQDAKNSGWPPGIVAEAYINFGWAGIVFGLPLIGFGLRTAYESCRPLLGRSIPVTVIYSQALYKLAFNSIELNLGQGITTALILAVPMILMLWMSSGATFRGNAQTGSNGHAGSPLARRSGQLNNA